MAYRFREIRVFPGMPVLSDIFLNEKFCNSFNSNTTHCSSGSSAKALSSSSQTNERIYFFPENSPHQRDIRILLL